MAKATGPRYKIGFKRRRKGLTNYAKRAALLKSGIPRFVVRRTNRSIITHFVIGLEDKTMAWAHSNDLKKFGWLPHANLPTAYLTGLLCGKRAIEKGIKEAVLDIGLATPTKCSTAFVAAKGAMDAGIKIPSSAEIDEIRIRGEHIAKYFSSLGEEGKKRFSSYLKSGVSPEKIVEVFNLTKEKIVRT